MRESHEGVRAEKRRQKHAGLFGVFGRKAFAKFFGKEYLFALSLCG